MLTATAVKNAKAKAKPYKLSDGRGLFLEVRPTGSKRWRYRFKVHGKESMMSLGLYPDVSLADAREGLEEARKLVAKGINPTHARKAEREASTDTFESVAREWHSLRDAVLAKTTSQAILTRLEKDAFPWIGQRPLNAITPAELLKTIRRIESRGANDIARRVLQTCGQVFRYAVACGRAGRDPSSDLRGALAPVKQRHHASLTDPKEVGALMRAIDAYTGNFITICALKFAPLVFVRPGELRHAEWMEMDFGAAEWRIPGEKMKMGEQHIVPLSRQALAVLEEIRPLTGEGKYVFPSVRSSSRPMSENTVNAALRRLGYTNDEMTGHGFRSMASTLLNELGWNRDAIERQLAHGERDEIRAAYNFAQYLPERRKMMQAWADYLDTIKKQGTVIPIKKQSA